MHKDIFVADNVPAYYAIPDGAGQERKYPGIILIHEIWGLKPHMKDVADRIAREGYVVVAPNLFFGLSFDGKIDQSILAAMQDPDKRDEAQKKMRELTAPARSPEFAEEAIDKIRKCFNLLMLDEAVNGKIGIAGFCFGGTYSFAFAAAEPLIKAAVPFYGHPPQPFEKINTIACPILAFYGEKDINLMESLPALTDAMKQYRKDFTAVTYPRCGHAFFNDTNPMMYNKEAAEDAWGKMLAFLKEKL